MTELGAPRGEPVTVVVARRVKQGRERDFEAWQREVSRIATSFEGHLGVSTFRPSDPAHAEYVTIFRFDSSEHLRRWNDSPERAEWLAKAAPLSESERTEVTTGLESWFLLPGQKTMTPPPRHKMCVVSWLGVYPLLVATSLALQPFVRDLGLPLRLLASTVIMTPLLTYAVMPLVTRLFAGWLYPKAR